MFEQNTDDQVKYKLLLLDLIKQKEGVEKEAFIESIHRRNLINYFLVYQYLRELEETGLILEKEGYLILSPKGEAILDLLSQHVPKVQAQEEVASRTLPKARGEIESQDTGHFVTLWIEQGEKTLFKLAYEVDREKDAREALTRWLENYSYLYLKIKDLIDEEQGR